MTILLCQHSFPSSISLLPSALGDQPTPFGSPHHTSHPNLLNASPIGISSPQHTWAQVLFSPRNPFPLLPHLFFYTSQTRVSTTAAIPRSLWPWRAFFLDELLTWFKFHEINIGLGRGGLHALPTNDWLTGSPRHDSITTLSSLSIEDKSVMEQGWRQLQRAQVGTPPHQPTLHVSPLEAPSEMSKQSFGHWTVRQVL